MPFPLFPDRTSRSTSLGEVRTPYFIGVKPGKDGAATIYYSKLGGKDADEILKKVLAGAGLP